MNNMNNQLKMKLTYTVYKVDSLKNENLNCLTKDYLIHASSAATPNKELFCIFCQTLFTAKTKI